MIRALIVEDSPVVQAFLKNILESDPEIEVAAVIGNGREAVAAVKKWRPDVVTMDINMPLVNGFEATRLIMEEAPTPVVIVSGEWDTRRVETTFLAMEAGALACVARPSAGAEDDGADRRELIATVKSMAEVRVIRRWPRRIAAVNEPGKGDDQGKPGRHVLSCEIKVVAIGASVGGPMAIKTILAALPGNLPWPVLIVQHIAAGFTRGLVEWLSRDSAIPVKIAEEGETIRPAQAYVAPDNLQMKVTRTGDISLTKEDSRQTIRPSVACLFRSVAEAYGGKAVGILLTGMGRDGAAELKMLKDRGALTVAQNEETAVVFGMPGEAVKLGAADYILPLEKIAPLLGQLAVK